MQAILHSVTEQSSSGCFMSANPDRSISCSQCVLIHLRQEVQDCESFNSLRAAAAARLAAAAARLAAAAEAASRLAV